MSPLDSTASLHGKTGLVVILCADETTRAAIAFWSTMLPVRTVVAEDGYHANDILRREDCRLLITDRVLPPWPGLDVFRHLRDRYPELRIAFIEGSARPDATLARLTGATDVLPHPLQQQVVFDTIDGATRPSSECP